MSLLCGFLGAGKTTLLKHVLETKHSEEDFKCAVIVNDMAALNIDKSLIDQSALVQSDEVIAMQNGCFCCTLQNDLVEQIIELAQMNKFNYMLIEASGVSEPSQIGPLFDLCNDEHDHDSEHKEGPELGEVAKLDTCVTVVDAAEFYNNLESMKIYEEGDNQGTIAELMTEQIEYSNVIVLNKQDLVTKEQVKDIMDRLTVLNPRAKVLKSKQSKINVMDILNTNMYSRAEMSVMTSAKVEIKKEESEEMKSCCKVSLDTGKVKCCKSKTSEVESGISQVLLGVSLKNNNDNRTRHEERFGITSFIYKSRRPFHPGRLYNSFMQPYFILRYEAAERRELRSHLSKLQIEAKSKQEKRTKFMGELLRSKGFVWIATTNKIMGSWQQAGNVLKLEEEGLWMSETRDLWEGTPAESFVKKDMINDKGEEYLYADRRQELVFIGIGLNHKAIQKALDDCLLTDEEMAMGHEKWQETMGPLDKIALQDALIVDYELRDYLEESGSDIDEAEIESSDNEEVEEVPVKKAKR